MAENNTMRKACTRLSHFNIYQNTVRILDAKLDRIVDVDFRNGEMFCGLCESNDCLHTGYAWSIFEKYVAK